MVSWSEASTSSHKIKADVCRLVEHFSPRCKLCIYQLEDKAYLNLGSHCRAFAPTWEQVARDKNHLERLTGFHMAQVDCLAQGGKQKHHLELGFLGFC